MFSTCTEQENEKTIENLKAAITGESNARNKYAAFAKKAHEEGFGNIAKMFEAISKAEAIHIANHYVELVKLGVTDFKPVVSEPDVHSTLQNLKEAYEGEKYEFTQMYPEFKKVADEEKQPGAKQTFSLAEKAESGHATYYKEAIDLLEDFGSDETFYTIWYVCPHCGDTYTDDNKPKTCDAGGEVPEHEFLIFQ